MLYFDRHFQLMYGKIGAKAPPAEGSSVLTPHHNGWFQTWAAMPDREAKMVQNTSTVRKRAQPLWKMVRLLLNKLRRELPQDPGIPTSGTQGLEELFAHPRS